MDRELLHINITAFPVGVERIIDPALRGRPVVIAAMNSPRAVALAISREAYLEGVRKGMAVASAKKFCRGLIVIPPNEQLYRRAALSVLDLVAPYSPLVEPWRPGHLHLDLTGTRRLFGSVVDTAAKINREIRDRLCLRNTVGVAQNKLVSRVASRVIRPRGLCEVFAGSEAAFLAPLEVDVLPGIGDKTAARLADFNIALVGELAAVSADHLVMAFGAMGRRLHQYARGIDDSPVRPPERAPLVAEEETLGEDANDDHTVMAVLYLLTERATRRLRAMRCRARSVKLELIYADHVSASREAALREPADLDRPVFAKAGELLEKTWARRVRLRWLGLTLKDLARGPRQLGLFDHDRENERERSLAVALDQVRARFGESALRCGRTL
ncbi:MAG TPA: DNA polymerase IV [bacterium]|nr:DNA polymerase IV [bacterium]